MNVGAAYPSAHR